MHNLLKAIFNYSHKNISGNNRLLCDSNYCPGSMHGYYDKDYGLLGKCLFKTAPYSTSNDLLITSGWFSMKTVVQATNYRPG